MSSHGNNTAYWQSEIWETPDHHHICRRSGKNIIHSKGIWIGDNPFDSILPLVLLQWLLAYVASRAVYFALRPLKQPKIVCYILGGILLGPSGLGRNQAFKEKMFPALEKIILDNMAALGEVYFLFLITTKMDVTMLLREGRSGWNVGSIGFVFSFATLSFLINSCVNYIGGLPPGNVVPFLIALALSISFFPVVAYALDELNLVTSELGQFALSFALVNDLILWCLAPLAIVFLQKSISQSVVAFFVFFSLTIFTIFVLRPIMLQIVRKTPEGEPVREVYVVLILVGALVMGFLSDAIGLNFNAGAQLLGYIIPEGPPLASILAEKAEFFVAEFLMPLWYLRIGLEVDVHSIKNWKSFLVFQGILFLGYFAKFLGVVLASISSKINPRHACLLGLLMNTKGVIDMLIFFRWKTRRHFIDEQSYAVLVFSSLAITAFVTPCIEMSCKHRVGPDPENEGRRQCFRSIQNTPRTTEFRVICCVHSQENVHGLISLLEASNPTEVSPICAYVVHLLDLVGRATPLLIPYNKRKRFKRIVNNRSFGSNHILRAFVNFSKNSNGPVTVQPFTMIAPYKSMHENIFKLAREKFVPLIIIPYHENQRATQGSRVSAAIRDLNANLQTYASCTVGVLVERGLRIKSCSRFSYQVAVIFIGGQDDREALAYAARMSSHPNVNVTVMRIILCKENDGEGRDEKIDTLKDEASFSSFKIKSIGDASVTCKEIMAEDVVKVVDAIRSMGKNYDLIMVGRRHWDIDQINDDEMSGAFVENDDLGMIGDVLASSEFFGDLASVLVLQHCRNLRGEV